MARGGRATARARVGRPRSAGLGVRVAASDHHRGSPSRGGTGRNSPSRSGPSRSGPSRSRRSMSHESSPSTRDIHVVAEEVEEEEEEDPSERSSEEYTPTTPTREDYQEEALRLNGEIAMLKDELARSQEEIEEVTDIMHHYQRVYAEEQLEVEVLNADNGTLRQTNGTLRWQCVELEWELRMANRSWRTRVGDRARYYGAAGREYLGHVRGYFAQWRRLYRQGPSIGFLWRYRPRRTYEEEVRAIYYPYDLQH